MADIQSFEEWFSKLRRQAVELFEYTPEAAAKFDAEKWKEYYLDGFTPKDALQDDSGDYQP